jgi:hypothetical protein
MRLPNQSEENQEDQPLSDETSSAGKRIRRKPKLVVYRKTISQHVGEKSYPTGSAAEESASLHPADGSPDGTSPAIVSETSDIPSGAAHENVRQPSARRSGRDSNPGRRLRAIEEAARKRPPAKLPWQYRLRPTKERTRRAYWDVASTISLLVNALLIGVLFIMYGQIRNLQKTLRENINTDMNASLPGMLDGLYSNFVKMDQATIRTTVQVDAQIPLDFNLPVSQNTQVVLTSDISIPRARVVINTGGLNINAPANVTLPAGTSLPIALNLNIPVQSTIPVSLQIPVSIPLNQSELHDPFTGLQTTLRPLVCMFNKNAQYPEGTYICSEDITPSP